MKIYANARVHTLTARDDVHEALVVDNGTVAFTGPLAQAREFASGAEEVDCGGNVIVPGLVDAHIHAIATAGGLKEVDLRSAQSLAEAVERIVKHEQSMPEGQWLTGGRWDANTWTDASEPNRELLDQLIPNRPVAVWSIDFHTLWLNGAALAAVGIDDDTPDPRGGRIVRDADGKATGVLREDAATIAERSIPVAPREARVDSMRTAQQTWLSEGLTGVHDFDGNASREAWEGLIAADDLKLKVVKYLRLDEWEWAKESEWRTGGRTGDRFIHGGLKLFSDGALGSHTCHMTHPFPVPGHDGQPNYGLPIASQDVLVEQILDAYDHGISAAIHAIGDQANRDVLNAFQRTEPQRRAAAEKYNSLMRSRIEHAQFMQEKDIDLMVSLGVVASMQPRHCISDIPLLPQVENNPGLLAYPWQELDQAGIVLAFGSDAPVEPSNPWAAIYASMTRADISGDPATTFQADKRISAYSALWAHTAGAAFAGGIESEAGVLAPGMDADFIVIDSDPFNAEGGNGLTGEYASEEALFAHATAVRDTQVQLTVTAGQEAWAR